MAYKISLIAYSFQIRLNNVMQYFLYIPGAFNNPWGLKGHWIHVLRQICVVVFLCVFVCLLFFVVVVCFLWVLRFIIHFKINVCYILFLTCKYINSINYYRRIKHGCCIKVYHSKFLFIDNITLQWKFCITV
jgi:hypothetical protein